MLMRIVIFCFIASTGHAVTSASDVAALNSISNKVSEWWYRSIPDPKPTSITALPVSTSSNLHSSFANIAESNILNQIVRRTGISYIECQQCKAPRVTVKDEKLLVTKGAPDNKMLLEIAKDLEVDAFLKIHVEKTFNSMRVIISVIRAGTNEVIAAESFVEGNITAGDSGLIIGFSAIGSFEFVPDYKLGLKNWDKSVPFGGEMFWHEKLGSGMRAGINAGALVGGLNGVFAYITTAIGARINIGQSPLALSPLLHIGLGYKLITKRAINRILEEAPSMEEALEDVTSPYGSLGITLGASLNFDIGRFFFIGARSLFFIPLVDRNKNRFSIYPGVNLGFYLGN